MPYQNTLPAAGTLTTSLTPLFTNKASSSVEIRLIKLTNNSCQDCKVNVYLDSQGVRTPLVPEQFHLKASSMAQDELVLQLRKDDAIEGLCDAESSVGYVIS